jgi:hypothetical protein
MNFEEFTIAPVDPGPDITGAGNRMAEALSTGSPINFGSASWSGITYPRVRLSARFAIISPP